MVENKKNFEIITEKIAQENFQDQFQTFLQKAKAGNLDNPVVVKTLSFVSDGEYIPMMAFNNDTERSCGSITFDRVELKRHCFELDIDLREQIDINNTQGIPDKIQISQRILNEDQIEKIACAQSSHSDKGAAIPDDEVANNIVSYLQDTTAKVMASSIDKQIATALTMTPQVGTDIVIGIRNVFKSVAEASSKIAPYKLTAIAMTPPTFFQILSTNEFRNAVPAQTTDGSITLPGFLNIPIILSNNIALNKKKEGRILFVSNEVPAVIKGKDRITFSSYYKETTPVFQYCVKNYVKSNIIQTKGKNKGVVSIDVRW